MTAGWRGSRERELSAKECESCVRETVRRAKRRQRRQSYVEPSKEEERGVGGRNEAAREEPFARIRAAKVRGKSIAFL